MGTPIAFASGTTNSFNLGTTKRGTIALNTGTNLTSGFNWWNGVDVSATQYIIYSDTFSQGQATIATATGAFAAITNRIRSAATRASRFARGT